MEWMAILTGFCVLSSLTLAAYMVLFASIGTLKARQRHLPDPLSQDDKEVRFLIIVPAHNEAEHILPTVRSLRRLDYPPHLFEISIVADNCTDNTAFIARQQGCQVWERTDPSRRGKGYALGWALERVSAASLVAVVIVDADTHCNPNLLQVFARELRRELVPLQATVKFDFPSGSPSWLSSTSRASQEAEELFVSGPRSHFGLYQGLQGTGFCIPANLLQVVPWSSYSICEDLEYACQLATKGVAVRFVQDTDVTALMTGRMEHASQQRERWARGTYGLIARQIPVQIASAVLNRNWKNLEFCFYLATRSRLPLAMLTLLSGSGLIIARHHTTLAAWVFFVIAAVLQLVYVFGIVSILSRTHSRRRVLLGFLRYSMWILKRHLGALLTLNRTAWNRTGRDDT